MRYVLFFFSLYSCCAYTCTWPPIPKSGNYTPDCFHGKPEVHNKIDGVWRGASKPSERSKFHFIVYGNKIAFYSNGMIEACSPTFFSVVDGDVHSKDGGSVVIKVKAHDECNSGFTYIKFNFSTYPHSKSIYGSDINLFRKNESQTKWSGMSATTIRVGHFSHSEIYRRLNSNP